MRHQRYLLPVLLLAMLLLAKNVGWAQDAVKVAPEIYKVLVDNDRVRVLDIHLKPGAKVPMHSHPALLIVAYNTCDAKFTMPDGKSTDIHMKANEVTWSDAISHAVENTGKTECHVLNIEMKKP